jgi:plastocyanin
MRRDLLLATTMLAAWTTFGATAFGANHDIAVGNNKTLSPNSGSASINLGDTVTWSWIGPDTNHIIAAFSGQAEQWDSDPGINDIDHLVGHSFGHTFTHEGAYTYRCRIHPDKMSGTITVSNPGVPVATFTMAPSPATVGDVVQFDGMNSTDPDGIILAWDWDLDGNGSFEATGATPTRRYTAAGSTQVTLRVTDNLGSADTETQTLVVAPAPVPPVVVPPVVPPVAADPPPLPQFVIPPVAMLTVTAAARQRGADAKGVAAKATCDVDCTVTASGSIALPGGKKVTFAKITRTMSGGRQSSFAFTVPAKSRAALRTLFKRNATATATLQFTVQGGATLKKSVKLAR